MRYGKIPRKLLQRISERGPVDFSKFQRLNVHTEIEGIMARAHKKLGREPKHFIEAFAVNQIHPDSVFEALKLVHGESEARRMTHAYVKFVENLQIQKN